MAELLQTGGQISLDLSDTPDRSPLCRGGPPGPGPTPVGGRDNTTIERSSLRGKGPTLRHQGSGDSSSSGPAWSVPV